MTSDSNDKTIEGPPKLRITDWIWIGLAVAIFVAIFLIILIYDVI
jgi:hypothetical protein